MGTNLLSFEDYCKKYNIDPSVEKAKEQYSVYCENLKSSDSLDSMWKEGRMPGEIFDNE